MGRKWGRVGVVLAGITVGLLAIATPASAHVSVSSTDATQGGYGKLTFRVPNEQDTASTVSVEVDFPAEAPLASVSVKALPGWTATVSTGKLATPIKDDDGNSISEVVDKIVWKAAAGGGIAPGQFQEFEISAGPLPKADHLTFKALQTYSDATIVRWIEEAKDGQPEPEHPAPTLTLAKKVAESTVAVGTTTTTTTAAPASNGTAKVALGLGVLALLVSAAGLFIALAGRRRTPTS